MSHIPSSAMPHARAADDSSSARDRLGRTLSAWPRWVRRGAGALRERARDNPRVTATAAATAALGLVAAIAFPLVRRRAA